MDGLAAIEAGLALGLSVVEACRRAGVHRSQYYRWRMPIAKPPIRRGLTPELRIRIFDLASEFPAWGCDRIAYFLKLEGHSLSSPTVQKALVEAGMGKRHERESVAKRRIST